MKAKLGIPASGPAWAFALASMFVSGGALAAEQSPGYVYDGATRALVKSGAGQCVRTSAWSEDNALRECDPHLFPEEEQVARSIAPVAEPKRVLRKIRLAADTTFAFDSAELTPEGKQRLDEVAVTLSRADLEQANIQIFGYTDRIGSPVHNEGLSERRAEAVKSYLLDKGVSEEAIRMVAGRGATNPVVSCDDVSGRSALIDCLAPNRRTEIEFTAFEPTVEQITPPVQQYIPEAGQ